MNEFLAGALAMASLVASLFFLRFWKSTHDRFFLYFAMSFLMEALSRILLAPTSGQGDSILDHSFYLLRLLSYGLILLAIMEKNRPRNKRKD